MKNSNGLCLVWRRAEKRNSRVRLHGHTKMKNATEWFKEGRSKTRNYDESVAFLKAMQDDARQELLDEIAKLRCTTDRICGAHIGAVDVHLTGNFALGCPCCQRDCANTSLAGYISSRSLLTVAEPANKVLVSYETQEQPNA